jgi:quercetin dioxygenase-like cupin family protein
MTAHTQDWVTTGEGVRRRIIVDGEKLMLVEVHFETGGIGAQHSHPHEQATYVLKGRLNFTVEGVTRELVTGESILIPSNAMHGVKALEETLLLDTFSPPREDFRA